MPSYLIRRLLLLGGIAVIGIVFVQSYWVINTWQLQDEEFDASVNILLRQVASQLADFNQSELPKTNLIQRKSSNTYAVNINSTIDASVLEDYLYQQLQAYNIRTDFEYAVFDCYSDQMVYGNYCELGSEEHTGNVVGDLPKLNDLIYYFVVRFPERESYLLSDMWLSVAFSIIAALAVIFFLYSIWVILQQKRLSELQKDFINNMTHEFKTPISSIRIAAETLQSSDPVLSNPRLHRYASIIKQQNSRLNEQVEKVLNLARMEKGDFELKKETFSLNRELMSIVQGEQMRLKDGTIEVNISKHDAQITADKLHFTNVITNVLDNAVKYCIDKPHISVSSRVDSDGSALVSIADNGIGINKEDLKYVFDKFYRVGTGNVHNVKGFGLGLYYVKSIADAHRWALSIDSEKGVGTTITFKIPQQKTA
jgi:two-component system phosphate regulon sensor histidine kinase PhoR